MVCGVSPGVSRPSVAVGGGRWCPWTGRAACTTGRSSTSCCTSWASTTSRHALTATSTSGWSGRTSSRVRTSQCLLLLLVSPPPPPPPSVSLSSSSSQSHTLLLLLLVSPPPPSVSSSSVTLSSSFSSSQCLLLLVSPPPPPPRALSVASSCESALSSSDMKYNFDKINTLNQGTPYDYGSVMQYERSARPRRHPHQPINDRLLTRRRLTTKTNPWTPPSPAVQVRLLQEQPAHYGAHPQPQRSLRPGPRDEQERHHQDQ